MTDEAQPTETPRWSRDLCDLQLDGENQACLAGASELCNAAIDHLSDAANRTVAAEARAEAAERERDRWFAERCEAQRESRRNIVCAEGAQRDRQAAVAECESLRVRVAELEARPVLPDGAELTEWAAVLSDQSAYEVSNAKGRGWWDGTDRCLKGVPVGLTVVARRKPEPVPLTRSIPASEVRGPVTLATDTWEVCGDGWGKGCEITPYRHDLNSDGSIQRVWFKTTFDDRGQWNAATPIEVLVDGSEDQ